VADSNKRTAVGRARDSVQFLRRRDGLAVLVSLMIAIGLTIALKVTGAPPPSWWDDFYVRAGMVITLLQVIPATIVAVFVFAAASVFVIAQLISNSLGSRAVLSLLTNDFARATVISGMMLLVLSIFLASAAQTQPEHGHAWTAWVPSAAGALAISTVIYVIFSVSVLGRIVWTFVDPKAYSESLGSVKWKGFRTSNDIYLRLRALRQWMRIASANGETRDINFALHGTLQLVRSYIAIAVEHEEIREHVPGEYLPEFGPSEKKGWFGDEVRGAIVRSIAIGIQSKKLLTRDAEGMLKQLEVYAQEMSHAGPDKLTEEVSFLNKGIVQVGAFRPHQRDALWDEIAEFAGVLEAEEADEAE
jgi:hypothetical protein